MRADGGRASGILSDCGMPFWGAGSRGNRGINRCGVLDSNACLFSIERRRTVNSGTGLELKDLDLGLDFIAFNGTKIHVSCFMLRFGS
jgi:hypothetical protein